MVDRFMLNLLILMNGRTIEDSAKRLLETSALKQTTPTLPSNTTAILVTGLEWVAKYLARAGLFEEPAREGGI